MQKTNYQLPKLLKNLVILSLFKKKKKTRKKEAVHWQSIKKLTWAGGIWVRERCSA